MALVITDTPDAYSSLHDDLIYTVSETVKTADPSTYPNYKFIADVYVNGTQVARIKKIPDPTTLIGIFNIGQVVRNYVITTFNPTGSVLVAQQLGSAVFFLSIQVKFGESYGESTTNLDVTTDSARVFFNNYNGRLVGTDSSLAALTNKVASSRPATAEVLLTTSHYFIPYFPTTTSAVDFDVTPTGGGSAYSTTFTPSAANTLQILNIAPTVLNALQAGTINASTRYYTVEIGSESYRIDLICEPIYTVYPVHFLNKYGGWESKLFNKLSRRTIDIARKDYGKISYTVDGSGVVSKRNTNGVYNETRSVYASQFTEKLTVNSDILTDAEYAWLEQLVVSPMVYLQDGSYFFPVVIKESNYEPKKVINDDLTNLTMSFEFGTTLNAQFR
jgi:hypothetical protein